MFYIPFHYNIFRFKFKKFGRNVILLQSIRNIFLSGSKKPAPGKPERAID